MSTNLVFMDLYNLQADDPHVALKFADMKINKAQNKQIKVIFNILL